MENISDNFKGKRKLKYRDQRLKSHILAISHIDTASLSYFIFKRSGNKDR